MKFRTVLMGLLGLAALLIAGCAQYGQKGVSPAEGVMFTCETYADTLTQLAGLNAAGKIKPSHQEIVEGVRETLNPICLGPAPDVDAKLKDIAVDNGVNILKSVLLISLSQS